ncbi:hypothetical protein ACU686_23865 [Yinghuangia aomiensis]
MSTTTDDSTTKDGATTRDRLKGVFAYALDLDPSVQIEELRPPRDRQVGLSALGHTPALVCRDRGRGSACSSTPAGSSR